jgi:hypothetical protein
LWAPIKTEATLKCLQKLHPGGPPPAPVPKVDSPRFTVDVVRAALSSFGPTSAAGLFGYKPLLLQRCVRGESFRFAGALTSVVNLFASGRAPEFLRRFIAGGVSIALEKNATSFALCVAVTPSAGWWRSASASRASNRSKLLSRTGTMGLDARGEWRWWLIRFAIPFRGIRAQTWPCSKSISGMPSTRSAEHTSFLRRARGFHVSLDRMVLWGPYHVTLRPQTHHRVRVWGAAR